jgi:hypothetical protein
VIRLTDRLTGKSPGRLTGKSSGQDKKLLLSEKLWRIIRSVVIRN